MLELTLSTDDIIRLTKMGALFTAENVFEMIIKGIEGQSDDYITRINPDGNILIQHKFSLTVGGVR
jgi:hypothetical protein